MSAILFFAIMLMSHSPDSNCRFNRKNSLTRRLILFLLTAPPTFLVIVTPSRERPCRPAEKTAIKYSFCILRPDFASAINSWRFKILSPFVKENCIGKNNYRPLIEAHYVGIAAHYAGIAANYAGITGHYADNRILPLALLRLMILLPCLVDILLRKP
jgi:hypothetical protein